jgi:hypothetical protein
MQTARATVSRGRLARVRIAWTSGADGVVRERDDGIRFVRWIDGPACAIYNISLSSVPLNEKPGEIHTEKIGI